jgi:hypothetical protein
LKGARDGPVVQDVADVREEPERSGRSTGLSGFADVGRSSIRAAIAPVVTPWLNFFLGCSKLPH